MNIYFVTVPKRYLEFQGSGTATNKKQKGDFVMNTIIKYMYRNGANWKNSQDAILSGTLTEDQKKAIENACKGSEYFIPRQVNLPEGRLGEITEDDHAWFELLSIEDTYEKPTESITADELYQNFMEVKGNWNETAWLEDLDEEEKARVIGQYEMDNEIDER